MPTERNSALGKAMLILREIASRERAVGLAELAEVFDLPRQTIHRTLQQLAEAGLIVRSHQKDRYVVGPDLTQLSVKVLASLNLRPPVRSILTELADETGETCNIGVLDQDEVVYIERVEGGSPLRLQLEVGSRVPYYCTAIGKLLVAEQHKNVRMRLLRTTPPRPHTSQTLTDANDLEQAFATIRSQGYSFNNEEYVEGLTAMSVPIKSAGGKAVAGLAIHAPLVRMDLEKALTYLASMRKKAVRIGQAWSIDTSEEQIGIKPPSSARKSTVTVK